LNFLAILFLLKFSIVNSSISSISNNYENAAEYIGDLAEDWNKIDPGIYDIQVYKTKFGGKFVDDFVESLYKSIPNENPISVRDFKTEFLSEVLRPRAFKIILSDTNKLVIFKGYFYNGQQFCYFGRQNYFFEQQIF
jgi:hypothetical protein